MAERELPEPPAEGSGSSFAATAEAAATAIGLALGKVRPGARLPPEAAEFLHKQSRMLDLQMEHLHEQRELQLSHLRWGRFSDRVKAALQVMTAVVGLVIVLAIAAMAWQAHEDHGLVIEAFSVPPDLAQRGLTGQAAANQLQDRLSELQSQTVTARPASTYANDWGGDIKVEIPATGVSFGELNRYLRQWLGSETHITGEVVRTPAGLAVTARAGSLAGKTFEGTEAQLGGLMQQAAEAVYAQTQPYRYAVYLSSHGQAAKALASYAGMAATGSLEDRPWAYAGWSSALLQSGLLLDAAEKARAALKLDPRLYPARENLDQSEDVLWHEEAVLPEMLALARLLRSGRAVGVPAGAAPTLILRVEGQVAGVLGASRSEATGWAGSSEMNFEGLSGALQPWTRKAIALAQNHDVTASRLIQAQAPPIAANGFTGNDAAIRQQQALYLEDWPALLSQPVEVVGTITDAVSRQVWPNTALALARLGRQAEAEALIARTPIDCDLCLNRRGIISAIAHDWPAADRWFGQATRQFPSIPFAYAFWGEALLAKGGFAGAVGKFREADKDAPRWGRNHLRWGEALARLGKSDEAKAQWRATAGMDLSVADRAELSRMQPHG